MRYVSSMSPPVAAGLPVCFLAGALGAKGRSARHEQDEGERCCASDACVAPVESAGLLDDLDGRGLGRAEDPGISMPAPLLGDDPLDGGRLSGPRKAA